MWQMVGTTAKRNDGKPMTIITVLLGRFIYNKTDWYNIDFVNIRWWSWFRPCSDMLEEQWIRSLPLMIYDRFMTALDALLNYTLGAEATNYVTRNILRF